MTDQSDDHKAPKERYVVQRRLKNGVYADCTDRATGRVEHATHDLALAIMRAHVAAGDVLDYRIIRRIWTCRDVPFGHDPARA